MAQLVAAASWSIAITSEAHAASAHFRLLANIIRKHPPGSFSSYLSVSLEFL